MTKITKKYATFSVLMLAKSHLDQNGIELNFLFIGLTSRPTISLRINLRGFKRCGAYFSLLEPPMQKEYNMGCLSFCPLFHRFPVLFPFKSQSLRH